MDLISKLSKNFEKELCVLENIIEKSIHHDIELIGDILKHVVCAGGKRFRPMLLIASTSLVGGEDFEKAAQMGAAIEMIHTATLLHDDVVDDNHLRRGRETSNKRFGNAPSILVGDYLFTKSFQLLIENKNMEILDIISQSFMSIAEGEVIQMMHVSNFDMDLETNLKIMHAKTAKLISAACKMGAIIGGGSAEEITALGEYGESLGILFQIADDLLDYTGDIQKLGKPIGHDFWEGKMTLPLVYALKNAPAEEVVKLKEIMKNQDFSQFSKVQDFIEFYHGTKNTLVFSKQIQEKALDNLKIFPQNQMRQFFEELVNYSLTRAA